MEESTRETSRYYHWDQVINGSAPYQHGIQDSKISTSVVEEASCASTQSATGDDADDGSSVNGPSFHSETHMGVIINVHADAQNTPYYEC